MNFVLPFFLFEWYNIIVIMALSKKTKKRKRK